MRSRRASEPARSETSYSERMKLGNISRSKELGRKFGVPGHLAQWGAKDLWLSDSPPISVQCRGKELRCRFVTLKAHFGQPAIPFLHALRAVWRRLPFPQLSPPRPQASLLVTALREVLK